MSAYTETTEKIDNDKRYLEALVPLMRSLRIREFNGIRLEEPSTCTACGRVSAVYYDGGGGRNLCKHCAKEEGCATKANEL
jgi:hypothetical protein